jgi:transcriptional regulator with XRE-family HTH domain
MPDMGSARVASELIGYIRRERSLSQAELARAAGMTRSVVNAYERGHRQPGVDALARIAEATGMRLRVHWAPHTVDPIRAGRILEQVLGLAQALPYRRPGKLAYPPMHRRELPPNRRASSNRRPAP